MSARRHAIRLSGLGLAYLLLAATQATAQWTTDPYDPWNMAYRPFVYPNFYENRALPNQARLSSIARGGQATGSYFESINGFEPDLFGGSNTTRRGRGVPYYQATRGQAAYDAAAAISPDRAYVPNRGDTFYEDQAARQQLFFEALRERNPRRRAELLGEVSAGRLEAARSASTPVTGRSGRGRTAIGATDDDPRLDQAPPVTQDRADDGLDLMRPLTPLERPATGRLPNRNGGRTRPGERESFRVPTNRIAVPPEVESLIDRPILPN